MEKVLIVLSGSTSVGKTTTLNVLMERLIREFNVTNISNMTDTKDKTVILNEVGNKKIKIGINTAGDNKGYATKSINLLDKSGCDIVVCSSKSSIRTDDGSIATFQKYYKEHKNDIILIPIFKIMQKGNESDYEENDKMMVDILMNQLYNYL